MNVFTSAKAAWHIDRIAKLRKGRDIVPTHVQLIISDLCNQDCNFCAYRRSTGFSIEKFPDEHGNRNPKRFIPTAKALEILDDCARLGVGAIEFTGGGEPTVHPDAMEIIAHAQDLGLETGLVTNGVLMRDLDVYRRLTWLRISLDAGTPETYEAIRDSKAWPKVMKNLGAAADLDGPYVGVGFVITKDNWQEIFPAAKLVRDIGIPYIRLSALFSTEGAGHYKGLFHKIRARRKQAARLENGKFRVVDLFGDRVADLRAESPDYDFCGEQQFVLYIGGDQKVYTCCTNAYTTHGQIGDLWDTRFADWLKSYRRFDFDARSCHHCQFNDKNRVVNYMLDPKPPHVDFV